MKKTLSLLLALILISLLIGCDSNDNDTDEPQAESSGLLQLVPQKANLIVYLNIREFLDDKDIERIYDSFPKESDDPQSIEESLDRTLGETGTVFNEGFVFFEIPEDAFEDDDSWEADEPEYGAFIIRGTFNQDGFIEWMDSESYDGLTTTDYKGYTIHVDEDDESAFAFIENDILVIGPGDIQSIKDVIDINEGDKSPIKGELVNHFNDTGNPMLSFAMVIPSEVIDGIENAIEEIEDEMDEMDGFGTSTVDLSVFTDLKSISARIDKNGKSIPVTVGICFGSESSAKTYYDEMESAQIELNTQFDDMRMIMPAGLGELIDIFEDIIDSTEYSRDGSCINSSIEITMPMIEDTIRIIEEFAEAFEYY